VAPSGPVAGEVLSYPLGFAPETGQVAEIAAGVKWLRLPLPFLLNHINVWLLRDGDGWALVDTGLFTDTTREVWRHVLEQHLGGDPITRVVVTHLHPDHVGCAGWLARKFDVDLWMSREEYLLCRVLVADTGKPAPREGLRFYQAAGFDGDAIDRYAEHFGAFGRVVAPLPEAYRRLRDGQDLPVGQHRWEVIVGRGHSPEHACLLCRELNLLIAATSCCRPFHPMSASTPPNRPPIRWRTGSSPCRNSRAPCRRTCWCCRRTASRSSAPTPGCANWPRNTKPDWKNCASCAGSRNAPSTPSRPCSSPASPTAT
jgi:glyoxylase-like metal-dependent hydrolase (beta-lactamase superfamily II)